MSPSCVFALGLCAVVAVYSLPVTKVEAPSDYDSSSSAVGSGSTRDALTWLYSILSQNDAFDGHALSRKVSRSPSRRLRFGRRSDPDMPAQAPIDEMNELLSLRDLRTPVRLRFGRRSDELAVPHVFPQEEQERDERAPSMRLRFGRRSDNMFLMPYEPTLPKEGKASSSSVEDDRQQE